MYRKKLHRMESIRSTIIYTLVDTLKAKNFVSDQHTSRLEKLIANMATFIRLPESTASLLARFYDIGKVRVSDSILLKKGSLTPEEWMEIKRQDSIRA
jgi:putative two-component system response regulator